ncbi:MAG: DUF4386 domain-containing protein [Saprospiraceae bacterium]|nr:DUF4386 domain-containing protein [Saprospiraceae bacterium]
MQLFSFSNNTVKYARLTGILYLLIFFFGFFSEGFVRGTLVNFDDAAQTANNILENLFLFRAGFTGDLLMVICDVAVAVAFYILLKPVSKGLAIAAAFFRLTQAAVIALNMIHQFQAILWVERLDKPIGLEPITIYEMVNMAMESQMYGYLISGVFFGVSCIILGYLFTKSNLFPTWLGYLLGLGGISYLIDCFTNFMFPSWADTTEILVLVTAVIAELAVSIWLLAFVGKRTYSAKA